MWTDDTRAYNARAGLALPSDLTDAEWAILKPLCPPPSDIRTRATASRPRREGVSSWRFGSNFEEFKSEGAGVSEPLVAPSRRMS